MFPIHLNSETSTRINLSYNIYEFNIDASFLLRSVSPNNNSPYRNNNVPFVSRSCNRRFAPFSSRFVPPL